MFGSIKRRNEGVSKPMQAGELCKEQYKRESRKAMISPFSQLKEGNFCSCPSITAATAAGGKATHLAGSFDRHGSDGSFFSVSGKTQRGITVLASCCL